MIMVLGSLRRITFYTCLMLLAGPMAGLADQFEDAVLAELKRARTDPKTYLERLKARHKKEFYNEQNQFQPPGATDPLNTKEGFAAVEKAIADLEAIQKLEAATGPGQKGKRPGDLKLRTGMSKAAKEHADDPRSNESGPGAHVGTDGSDVAKRIARHGDPRLVVKQGAMTKTSTASAENIGFGQTAQEVVERLIIDDGLNLEGKTPQHRVNILASQFCDVGIACVDHPRGKKCVITFSIAYKDR